MELRFDNWKEANKFKKKGRLPESTSQKAPFKNMDIWLHALEINLRAYFHNTTCWDLEIFRRIRGRTSKQDEKLILPER